MKIVIAGDFCPQQRVARLLDDGKYKEVLGGIQSVLSGVDYSIVNLECPILFGNERPIEKCGCNLGCSERDLLSLKWAGFDCVTLANNHFYDFGEQGVMNTITSCMKNELDFVGGGLNQHEASRVLYKVLNSQTLAIINCCEHEFSIATKNTGGSNPLGAIQQYYNIVDAKAKADYVLVIIHGGNEYYQLPSPRMKELYRFFIDAGADAVVNHHQHCFSGYEVYKEKPIFYGIGNLCFDDSQNNDKTWNEGYIVELRCDAGEIKFKLHPYVQCEEQPTVNLMTDDRKITFERELFELNRIIVDDDLLEKSYEEFLNNNRDEVRSLFLPVVNRITLALCRRRLLPSFLSVKNKYKILNFLMCESHYPKVVKYVQSLR